MQCKTCVVQRGIHVQHEMGVLSVETDRNDGRALVDARDSSQAVVVQHGCYVLGKLGKEGGTRGVAVAWLYCHGML
jgi:hypothetical protein